MKKLTCEMCGSTSLIKKDGVFVCESCGMKYSAEEAKKLMISALFAAGFLGVAMASAADADMLPLAVVLFIFGAIFAFIAVACGKTASGKAKAILADRIALAKRLDAKIKELSE